MDLIFDAIERAGGTAYYVGGYVRDKILGLHPKDVDIEVFGLSSDNLVRALSTLGDVKLCGESFGVYKLSLNGSEIDISLPRRDSKCGVGHKGFDVQSDPNMTIVEAASRRDFTINAMSMTRDGQLIDLFNGLSDLKNGVLKHTSSAFAEDPLRVLRGMQFCARFKLRACSDTIVLCNALKREAGALSVERIGEEFRKMFTKGKSMRNGMEFLLETGWLFLFGCGALGKTIKCAQDPIWHPEGSVWQHTLYVMDAMVDICEREGIEGEDREVLILAALLHDIGKPLTTSIKEGRIVSPGHDVAGVKLAQNFMHSINVFDRVISRVLHLVRFHMIHCSSDITEKTVRRWANRLAPAKIEELVLVMEADYSGRPPLPKGNHPDSLKILEIAKKLGLEKTKPKPLVMGRHLQDLMPDGPEMGALLKDLFERQLDGEFSSVEDGIKIAKECLCNV